MKTGNTHAEHVGRMFGGIDSAAVRVEIHFQQWLTYRQLIFVLLHALVDVPVHAMFL